MTEVEFIAKILSFAVVDMRRSKVPASLTISQAALESGWGASKLTVKANNLFGIKGSGPAGSITMQTTEYVNGRPIKVAAAFRAYNNWGESITDHSALIVNGVSWNRSLYRKAVGVGGEIADREIAAAGYATDPNYAAKLIRIMDAHNLYQYDDRAKEDDEMSAEDKQKLIKLESELKGLRDRLSFIEGRAVTNVPAWADAAVKAAIAEGL